MENKQNNFPREVRKSVKLAGLEGFKEEYIAGVNYFLGVLKSQFYQIYGSNLHRASKLDLPQTEKKKDNIPHKFKLLPEIYKQTAYSESRNIFSFFIQRVKNRVTKYIDNSNINIETKILLHYINKNDKWFLKDVKYQNKEIPIEIIKLCRKIFKKAFKQEEFPILRVNDYEDSPGYVDKPKVSAIPVYITFFFGALFVWILHFVLVTNYENSLERKNLVNNVDSLTQKITEIKKMAYMDYELPTAINFCGNEIPLTDKEVKNRFKRELDWYLERRSYLRIVVSRTYRFLPFVEDSLKAWNLPTDLVYLPVVESDLDINARSGRNASGLWQFMPATAKGLGLKVDKYVDERYDIFKSTSKAMKYLTRLYKQFDDWLLCLAAYNVGENWLETVIVSQGSHNSYMDMVLNSETGRYVFRVLAFKYIYENQEKFNLEVADYEKLSGIPEFIEIKIKEGSIFLGEVAEELDIPFDNLHLLNASYRVKAGYIIPKGHILRIPTDKKARFFEALAKLKNKDKLTQKTNRN
jgi:hypothetical protein